MREGCSCGAYIHARRSDVLEWRRNHTCLDRSGEVDQVMGSQVENAAFVEQDGLNAQIGFQRELW